MFSHVQSYIDMMTHVSNPGAKPKLEIRIAEYPGVIKPWVRTSKPNLLFVSYDPAIFDLRSAPRIVRSLGVEAQIIDTYP